MKYLKMLGLVAVAAAAMMAFAGSASAATLTSPAGTALGVGTVIHAHSEGHATLDSPIGQIRCNSTVEGEVTNAGGHHDGPPTETTTVSGHIDVLNFTGCTTATVHVLQPGTLEIHSLGSGNGTLTSSGASVTVETFGAHCIYGTNNTDIGTLTGGSPATLDISANIPRTGGKSGVFCGSSAPWTGSYEVTKPNPLFVS